MGEPFRDRGDEAADERPDPDRKWYERVLPDDMDDPAPSDPMTPERTAECAKLVLELVLHDADFRREYYNISRSWHKLYATQPRGGNFESKWLELLRTNLPDEYGDLTLQDFANVHAHVFYTLQRAVLAITSHDIDIDAIDHWKKPSPRIESFHWVPNDGVDPVYSPGAMGFSKVAP